jgi:hypothetical protein
MSIFITTVLVFLCLYQQLSNQWINNIVYPGWIKCDICGA